jgi:hypothetical protein
MNMDQSTLTWKMDRSHLLKRKKIRNNVLYN